MSDLDSKQSLRLRQRHNQNVSGASTIREPSNQFEGSETMQTAAAPGIPLPRTAFRRRLS
ncbi:hypothetical protein FH063_001109 [Azospirillum argentinense]|uniref:Uncharacterized protein n=1 Tax=Azospirillum argentinense TaxID=2970906 RepID=A0A5B0L3J1_9PROT|nr:hypothetical protein FH063_001109 [Azospirillum argentinense]